MTDHSPDTLLRAVQIAVDRLHSLAEALDFIAESSLPGVRTLLIHLSNDASLIADELDDAHHEAQPAINTAEDAAAMKDCADRAIAESMAIAAHEARIGGAK